MLKKKAQKGASFAWSKVKFAYVLKKGKKVQHSSTFYLSELESSFHKIECETIEPCLVLNHISYLSTPKKTIFRLVMRVNTRDFTEI